MYLDSINAGLQFNQEEMQMFEEALLWAGQHEKAYNIFCVLLLMISNKKRQKCKEIFNRFHIIIWWVIDEDFC